MPWLTQPCDKLTIARVGAQVVEHGPGRKGHAGIESEVVQHHDDVCAVVGDHTICLCPGNLSTVFTS